MLGRMLKRDSSETLSLEVMGIIAGTESLGVPGRAANLCSRKADQIEQRITRTLEREGLTTDPGIRNFLEMSRHGLRSLSSIPDSIGEDIRLKTPEHHTDPVIKLRRPNPDWQRKLTAFQGAMRPEAQALFEQHFSREADQRIRKARMQALEDLRRRDIRVDLQIKLNG